MKIKREAHAGARGILLAGISAGALMIATGVMAQEAAPAAPADNVTEVVVTGYRASLQSALRSKKNADVIMDAIDAEDIADFPDSNLAESLQRIPGISIDRDNGEGRTISVRGLDGGFSRVRINNMEALSTSGANNADGSPNRSRSFDFNAFASELFSSVRVRKSSSAEADEGSLGATVDLITGRPFDFKTGAIAFSAENSYYENSGKSSPRVTGLFSRRWADGRLGFLGSVAWAKRSSEDDNYARSPGGVEYVYRSTDFTGDELPGRAGFAAPTGTVFTALIPAPANVTGAALTAYKANPANYYNPVANPLAYAELTGSDPAAYAKLHPNCATTTSQPVANLTPTSPGCNDSLIRFPALASVSQRNVDTERLGITTAFQAQITPRTRLSVDFLYSKFESESTNYQLGAVGLNRNNTNAAYAFGANVPTATARSGTAMTDAQRRALYPGGCSFAVEDALNAGYDCGQQIYGTTPAAGYTYSLNPKNLDPYEYYTNVNSPGYAGPAATLPFRGDLIGRPSTKVLAAEVEGQNATYLELSNVDWRSGADRGVYTTEFSQVSFELTHQFSERLFGKLAVGASKSSNDQHGYLVEFNRLDAQETYTWDQRNKDSLPVFDPGFDAANPANWGIVKGLSAMRHYRSVTENEYAGWKADFSYDLTEHLTFKFGATQRKFDFFTQNWTRGSDIVNPTEKEAGVSVASLGNIVEFGQGLDLQEGTVTSFFVPNLEAFDATFGFMCDCVNAYGDWRISTKRGRAAYNVSEKNDSFYGQLDFKYEVLGGRRLSGNIGVRQAKTEINSIGQNTVGRIVTGHNEYTDTLPAANVTFEVFENLYIRAAAAKVMARPSLGVLSPQITAINIPSGTDLSAYGTLSVGNPKLAPYRGKSFDVSAEWYFTQGGLISLGWFRKEIDSFPQTIFYEGALSEFLTDEERAALKLQFPGLTGGDVNRRAWIDNDGLVQARQMRDTPGGYLEGWEFSYQQDLTFLPWYFKNLGVQFNMTKLESEFQYLIDPGSVTPGTGVVTRPATWAPGPWLGSSPKGMNFTLYYETEKFNARVSVAKRDEFYKTYPIGVGSCDPGLQANGSACNSPLINEFGITDGTTNVDMSMRYAPIKRVNITFEALNLTNETGRQYAYTDPALTSYSSTGRNFRLGLRYKY
ncbi:TonB-dependent receptor domain-containing protein [Asticcacaulis machinosus]|uniref:TonB-dependent receptor n=1 Tax=Asticcacaulis machinosus TaxID=2984211 RepID=A0ABT5HLU2_9CAUL|nr:TonB-dependent receptor [Asticcacaulis machinosus]MDC7677207.1 TonB-dependent receptor [Asticcacaulis machinosus]